MCRLPSWDFTSTVGYKLSLFSFIDMKSEAHGCLRTALHAQGDARTPRPWDLALATPRNTATAPGPSRSTCPLPVHSGRHHHRLPSPARLRKVNVGSVDPGAPPAPSAGPWGSPEAIAVTLNHGHDPEPRRESSPQRSCCSFSGSFVNVSQSRTLHLNCQKDSPKQKLPSTPQTPGQNQSIGRSSVWRLSVHKGRSSVTSAHGRKGWAVTSTTSPIP